MKKSLSLFLCLLAYTVAGDETSNEASLNSLTRSENVTICTIPQVQAIQTNNLWSYLSNLTNTSSYPARWDCGTWTEFEGWFMIISDLSIFFAYFSIPIILIFVAYKKKGEIPFRKFFILFAVFIVFCGLTHLMDVVLFWQPMYRLSGLAKFFTGVISCVTAVALAKGIPKALNYKSPVVLQNEIIRRKRAQEHLNAFIRYSPGAVAMFDRDIKYLSASDQWFKDYNLEGQEIIGVSHYEIFPEIGEEWKEIHQECLNGKVNINDRAEFPREDGTSQWIRWHVRPWYDEQDEIGGIIMQTENISSRIESENKLRISETQFRGAFEYSANGMAIVDPSGKWTRVNKSLCEIIGYTDEELLRLTFQDITHPEDLDKDLSLLEELVQGKRESYQMEKRYFHKNGSIVWVILAVSMVTDNKGEPLYFVSQIKDITPRKRAEARVEQHTKKLEEKNKELQQFTYIASHDLREPVNTILGFTDIMKSEYSEKMDENFNVQMDFISDSAHRMSDLIKELLDYSRLNEVRQLEKVNLDKVVADAVSDLNQLIKTSNAKIKINPLGSSNGVNSNLRILFQNLINNGIKFQEEDAIAEIEIGTKSLDGNKVYFVADNGIGIKQENTDKIFKIFQKLHHRDEYAGSGIGLANSKKIVENQGGKIWVESEPGKGSTFYFTLGS